MTLQFILAQAIGLIGVGCFIASFQIKSNRALFAAQSMGNLAFLIQFYLLGGITGCYALLVLIIRNLLLCRYNEWKWVQSKGWMIFFCLAGVLTTVLTWNGPASLLPMLAVVGGTIGMWTNNAQHIRLANLVCCSPSWLIYDIIVKSYAGMLNETLILGSILISIFRYGWRAMGDPDSDFQK